MFSCECTDGSRVVLRHATAEEIGQMNERFVTNVENRTGLQLNIDLFAADRGVLAFPNWHIHHRDGSTHRVSFVEVLQLLTVEEQQRAVDAHLQVMADIHDHGRSFLNGVPTCVACIAEDDPVDHFADLDETFEVYSHELTMAVMRGLLACTPPTPPTTVSTFASIADPHPHTHH